MRRPEQELHKAVTQYLNLVLPKSAFWTSLDHAGGGPMVGRFRKARGVKKGLPDILIIYEGRCSFIELKSAAGHVSPEQKTCAEQLMLVGCNYKVARSIDDVRCVLTAWNIPTREHSNLTAFHFKLEAA